MGSWAKARLVLSMRRSGTVGAASAPDAKERALRAQGKTAEADKLKKQREEAGMAVPSEEGMILMCPSATFRSAPRENHAPPDLGVAVVSNLAGACATTVPRPGEGSLEVRACVDAASPTAPLTTAIRTTRYRSN